MTFINRLRTRATGIGRPDAATETRKRVHGLQNRFNFDFVRLGRIATVAVAMMAAVTSVIEQPFEEAISYLRQKADVKTKSWRDVWDAAHSKMFMVAGANTDAIVADFHAAILKAIETGTTLDEFRKDFDKIVGTHGWSYRGERGWRTRTIFETNLRTAYAAGRYAQMTKPDMLEAYPYWRYNHSGALHPRQEHKSWDGICLAHDDPFWQTAYPPNGFRCGCFVTPVSARRLKALGKDGPDTAPDLDQPGTDQPRGVDPSFAYNPGAAWLTQTAPGPKAVSASEAMVAAFVRSASRGKWPDKAWTPVAIADDAVAKTLSVPAGTEIRLSAETIRQHHHHPEADADTYATVLKRLLNSGQLVRDNHGRWVVVGKIDDKGWHCGIKTVPDRNGQPAVIYLNSLRRTNVNRLRKLGYSGN